MQTYLLRLHQEYAFSMIIVSHNLQEIYTLAQRVATLNQGKLSITYNNELQSWNTVQSNGLVLEGNIIKIKQVNKQRFAVVLIGENIIEIPFDQSFQIGQKIKVVFKDGHLKMETSAG